MIGWRDGGVLMYNRGRRDSGCILDGQSESDELKMGISVIKRGSMANLEKVSIFKQREKPNPRSK